MGTGRGGSLHLYLNRGAGSFEEVSTPKVSLDTATILGWRGWDGRPTLLTAYSKFEQPELGAPALHAFSFDKQAGFFSKQTKSGLKPALGAMTLGDVDGDGDLDLFVGGRNMPRRYPEPVSSYLFLNVDGDLKIDEGNAKAFEDVGLVSGAVFGDIDGDGDPDLILAKEWGPVTLFENDGGRFHDVTERVGLSEWTGWWNSVTLVDLNEDGRLDIVAGNWGRNTKYEHAYSHDSPLRIYYADFDSNGTLDIVEARTDPHKGTLVPERGFSCSSRAMPFIRSELRTYRKFGSCSLKEIYKERLEKARQVTANTLDHMVFLNEGGGGFDAEPLPIESQLAPVFGLNAADFDGDGHQDLFLAQNFFEVQAETPRCDGGRGLLLLGSGDGKLKALAAGECGVWIYGEQRGSAVGDFNQDGRPDLAVSQNAARTLLLENQTGSPGLRVRIDAGAGNPTGVGAIVRARSGGRLGPAQIVTAGSGYWSQYSATLIATADGPIEEIATAWPGGGVSVTAVKPRAKSVVLRRSELKVRR